MLMERIRGYFKPNAAHADIAANERRRALRKSVLLRATIYPIDVFSDARIRDISETGVKGETDVELAIGQTLHITSDEKIYHTGRVKWTLDRQFGLELTDAIEIFAKERFAFDHGSEEGHHPRSPRVAVDLSARLVGGRPPRPAIVRNVSYSGLLLDTSPGLKPGQHMIVRIGDALPIYGRTQWVSERRLGFKAHTPISVFSLTSEDTERWPI